MEFERHLKPDLSYLVALRVPLDFIAPKSVENVAEVIVGVATHGAMKLDYISEPRLWNGDLSLGMGLHGSSPYLCASDCRSLQEDLTDVSDSE